jgi:hypothetical protein
MGIRRFRPQARLWLFLALTILIPVSGCTSSATLAPLSHTSSIAHTVDPVWIELLTSVPTPPVQEIVAYTDYYYKIVGFHLSEGGRQVSYYLQDLFPGKEKGQVIRFDRASDQQQTIWANPAPLPSPFIDWYHSFINWSPDGNALYFESEKALGPCDRNLVNLRSGSLTKCPTTTDTFLSWNPFSGLPLFLHRSGRAGAEPYIVSTPIDRWAPSTVSPPFPQELGWDQNFPTIWIGQECIFRLGISYEKVEYWSYNFQARTFSLIEGVPLSGHEDRLLLVKMDGNGEKRSEFDVHQIWLKEGAATRLLFTWPPGSTFKDVIGWLNADQFLFRISFGSDQTALCVCRILPQGAEVRKLYAWKPTEPMEQYRAIQLGLDQALWGLATNSFPDPTRESIVRIPLP